MASKHRGIPALGAVGSGTASVVEEKSEAVPSVKKALVDRREKIADDPNTSWYEVTLYMKYDGDYDEDSEEYACTSIFVEVPKTLPDDYIRYYGSCSWQACARNRAENCNMSKLEWVDGQSGKKVPYNKLSDMIEHDDEVIFADNPGYVDSNVQLNRDYD